jgi:hypothetical protein
VQRERERACRKDAHVDARTHTHDEGKNNNNIKRDITETDKEISFGESECKKAGLLDAEGGERGGMKIRSHEKQRRVHVVEGEITSAVHEGRGKQK